MQRWVGLDLDIVDRQGDRSGMKPRTNRKLSRLKARFPLGSLVVVEQRGYSTVTLREHWTSEHMPALIVGTWKQRLVSIFGSVVTDTLGACPRSRTSMDESGYLLLTSSPDTPLLRVFFEDRNLTTKISLVCDRGRT